MAALNLKWTADDLCGRDPATVLVSDTEVGPGHWTWGGRRLSDGKEVLFEHSFRKQMTDAQRDRLRRIMEDHTIVGYNYLNYDWPMVAEAIRGADNETLKRRSDQIIGNRLRYWQMENVIGYRLPEFEIWDLFEPQPNPMISLKALNGRMHGRWMQELPYHHEQELTAEELDHTIRYMWNDLDATELLLWNLRAEMKLRAALGKQYGMNFMSKSDSQIGEAIVKKKVEQALGRRVERVDTPPGTTFHYKIPPYLRFYNPQLVEMTERLAKTEFVVKADGKVDLPKWISEAIIQIDEMIYSMGIGGLHSTEANRSIYTDADHILIDFDVASYYPAIILNSGLFPKALGPLFLEIYRAIRDERVRAKQAGEKVTAEGLKIALNGVFGKLGSKFSVLYAPHLLLATTLTGQLSVLMLIDWLAQAGVQAVSGNTDGVVFKVPRSMYAGLKLDENGKVTARLNPSPMADLIENWEKETGFELEAVPYRSLHNISVNTYIAIKEDGKIKRKGTLANPWSNPDDTREQLKKTPNMTICSDAVTAFIQKGVPLEKTILECKDVRGFITVVKVTGGGVWGARELPSGDIDISGADYLGKEVRYYWAADGKPIFYKTADSRTGNHKKVPKTDGARPMMTLLDELPEDLDLERYVQEARELLMECGAAYRPPEAKKITVRGWRQAQRVLRTLVLVD